MNPRFFLLLLLAVLSFVAGPQRVAAAEGAAAGSQYYELRVYSTQSEAQQKMVSDYWEKAAVPAYNRMGIKPIGVFTELADSPTNKVYVLIPYDSPGAFAAIPAKLAADTAYQTAAADYLGVARSNAAFVRIESSILVAFDSWKKLTVPPSAAEKKPWIFELRTYQSYSEAKGIAKVDMFNSGESEAMKESGLSPVFFGQAVVGPQMPNLVYMLSSENQEEYRKHFSAFAQSPTWKKISADPLYRDTVSKAITVFLKRMSASQI